MSDEQIYKLTITGDEFEIKRHLSVNSAIIALGEIKQLVRKRWKYEDQTGKDPHELVSEIYDEILDVLRDNELSELI